MLANLRCLCHASFLSKHPPSVCSIFQFVSSGIESKVCFRKAALTYRVVPTNRRLLGGFGAWLYNSTRSHFGGTTGYSRDILCKISSTSKVYASVTSSNFHNSATSEQRVAMQAVSIKCRGDIADGMMEALLCFGANSCSVEDAHLDTLREQEIHAGTSWQVGLRQLWEEVGSITDAVVFAGLRAETIKGILISHITAIFPEEQDVGEAIAMASHSIGINQMPQYKIEIMEDQEWLQQLQNVFEPLEIAAGLWIVPRWLAPPDPTAVNVMLEPGLAFGTGEHPTTRLCLRWLHRVVKGGENVLDYGVGSGILSIAALKMGAARAVGVDVDPMAISSANSNAFLNSIEDHRFEVFLADVNGGDPVPVGGARHEVSDDSKDCGRNNHTSSDFDIIVANILANPLMELACRISNYGKPGSLVGVSGLLVEQVDQVLRTYMEYLDNVWVSEDSGWACITGTKKVPQ